MEIHLLNGQPVAVMITWQGTIKLVDSIGVWLLNLVPAEGQLNPQPQLHLHPLQMLALLITNTLLGIKINFAMISLIHLNVIMMVVIVVFIRDKIGFGIAVNVLVKDGIAQLMALLFQPVGGVISSAMTSTTLLDACLMEVTAVF